MFECAICECPRHEVIFTTSDKLGGSALGIPVIVCDECMENIEAFEESAQEK